MAPLPIADVPPVASTVIANITTLRITIYLLQFLLCLLFLHALPRADAIRRPDRPLRQKDVLELPTLPLAAALTTRQRRRRDTIALRAIDASILVPVITPWKKDPITTDSTKENNKNSNESPHTTSIPKKNKDFLVANHRRES